MKLSKKATKMIDRFVPVYLDDMVRIEEEIIRLLNKDKHMKNINNANTFIVNLMSDILTPNIVSIYVLFLSILTNSNIEDVSTYFDFQLKSQMEQRLIKMKKEMAKDMKQIPNEYDK